MTGNRLTVALWQGAGQSGDVAANLREVELRAGQARARGADLLIFPECFLTGYVTPDPSAVAAALPADPAAELARIAAETGICLVVGTYLGAGAGLENVALAADPDRGPIASYSKQMLFGDWEKATFRRGNGPVTFDLKGWKIGLLICFDVEFPGLVRTLAQAGCDLVAVPTALMEPFANVPRYVVPARAIENQIFVAYANRTGDEGSLHYVGLSTIAGPEAPLAAAADDSEQMLIATLSKDDIAASRRVFDYLAEEAGRG